MPRIRTAIASTLAPMLVALGAGPLAAQEDPTEVLVAFDPAAGQLSEGVAVDGDGNVFASLSPLGQLVKVAAGTHDAEPFGAISGLAEGDIGLIGLTTDADGNVYGAAFSANPEVNGVWRFEAGTGVAERVDGTEAITMPNSVAFDDDGTMYITDTINGAVWRVTEGGSAESWLADPLLMGTGDAGFGFPIGANGIDVADDTVYVGVTELGSIVAVPITADGSAGEPSVHVQQEGLVVDGISVGPGGEIYIADPIANDVIRVDMTGDVSPLGIEGLDGPTSVDLGVDEDGYPALYVANFSVALGTPLGAGPSVVAHSLKD